MSIAQHFVLEYLATDDTLHAHRGMVKLKQYNPKKPAKYGLLYRSISDSVVPYTFFTLPYAGKPEIEGSEFYVTGTNEYGVYLADNLSSHVDRYFTSVTIPHYLRTNRKGIPKELVEMQNRGDKYIKFVHADEDDMVLTSYVVKKISGKRNILLLGAMHDDVRCSGEGSGVSQLKNRVKNYDVIEPSKVKLRRQS